jgi:hypothetical protein
MKSSLPFLLRLFVLFCPFTIWSQPLLTAANIEISAPELDAVPTFNYVKLKGSDDVNVQYYLTTALAVAAGYDHDTAISIGLYNQLLDDTRKTSSSPWLNFKARRQYHFTIAMQREKLWSQFETSHEIPKLSMYLHALQDSFYHQGFGWVLGHIFKGHQPDQSWLAQNFVKNHEVLIQTYSKLLAAAPLLKQQQAAIPFENFSKAATEFLQASSVIEKSEKYQLLCSRIETPNSSAKLLNHIQLAMATYDSDPNFRQQLSQKPENCKAMLQLQNLQALDN